MTPTDYLTQEGAIVSLSAMNNNTEVSLGCRDDSPPGYPPLYHYEQHRRNSRTRAVSHEGILNPSDVIPQYNHDLAERIRRVTETESTPLRLSHNWQPIQQHRQLSQSEMRVIHPREQQQPRERAHTFPRWDQEAENNTTGSDCLYLDEEVGVTATSASLLRHDLDSATLAPNSFSTPQRNSRDDVVNKRNNPIEVKTCPQLRTQRTVTFDLCIDEQTTRGVLFSDESMPMRNDGNLISSSAIRARSYSLIETPNVRTASFQTTEQFETIGTPTARLTSSASGATSDSTEVSSTPSHAPRWNSTEPVNRSSLREYHSDFNGNTTQITIPPNLSGPQLRVPMQGCILRLNLNLIKILMVLSLYTLLAYTWKTDLRFRYKSNEINYGLNEYWHGAIPSLKKIKVENLWKNTGKLFIDDSDDDVKAELLKGVFDKPQIGVTEGNSGDLLLSIHEDSSISDEKKKRRPYLSHARSISDASPGLVVLTQSSREQRLAIPQLDFRKKFYTNWSLLSVIWYFVWMMFSLPLIEVGLRLGRHHFQLYCTRRFRHFRSVSNIHDL